MFHVKHSLIRLSVHIIPVSPFIYNESSKQNVSRETFQNFHIKQKGMFHVKHSSDLNQVISNRKHSRLGPVCHSQLFEYIGNMILYCPLADVQPLRDFFVVHSNGKQLQHF